MVENIIFIINILTYKNTMSIRSIIEKVRRTYQKADIDLIISEVLKLKNSYVEYDFYKKTEAILYFMKLDNASEYLIKPIEEDILKVIEKKYFMNSPGKKMLKDMGVYDKDVNIISNQIGENVNSIDELQLKIKENYEKIMPKISIISQFIINRLVN